MSNYIPRQNQQRRGHHAYHMSLPENRGVLRSPELDSHPHITPANINKRDTVPNQGKHYHSRFADRSTATSSRLLPSQIQHPPSSETIAPSLPLYVQRKHLREQQQRYLDVAVVPQSSHKAALSPETLLPTRTPIALPSKSNVNTKEWAMIPTSYWSDDPDESDNELKKKRKRQSSRIAGSWKNLRQSNKSSPSTLRSNSKQTAPLTTQQQLDGLTLNLSRLQ